MEELVKLVSQKTGLSEEMSKTVVNIVINFIKEKLPAPLAAQVDGLLNGGGLNSDLMAAWAACSVNDQLFFSKHQPIILKRTQLWPKL
jgi:hypothetical protein